MKSASLFLIAALAASGALGISSDKALPPRAREPDFEPDFRMGDGKLATRDKPPRPSDLKKGQRRRG